MGRKMFTGTEGVLLFFAIIFIIIGSGLFIASGITGWGTPLIYGFGSSFISFLLAGVFIVVIILLIYE